MEYLCNLNLSPKREAMYKAILLEEKIDEQVLGLMDAPPIAEDIAAQTSIPLAISRRLVDDARSVLSGNIPAVVLPHSPPDEHPPRSPSAYSDSPSAYSDSSSSSDESEEEQPANSDYPRIRSPQALSSLVRFIHSAVDEAAQAQEVQQAGQERRAPKHADAGKDAQQRYSSEDSSGSLCLACTAQLHGGLTCAHHRQLRACSSVLPSVLKTLARTRARGIAHCDIRLDTICG